MRFPGYSLIEVIMVMAIISVVTGMTVPLYRAYQIRSDLNIATEQATQGIGRARFLAQGGEENDSWGFYVPAGILFKGSSYAARDATYDETYPMPSTITFSGLTEVWYEKITGNPSATGAVTLTALTDDQRTVLISVETEAVAVVENDNLIICHRPSGNPENMSTMSISESAWPTHRDNHGGDTLGPCPGQSSVGTASSSSSAASSVPASSSAASSAGAAATCQDRFSVSADGTITTTGPLSVTYTVLGSDITYGEGGPDVNVYVSYKKLTGNSYQELYSGNDVDGGETQTVTGYANGSQVVVKVRGYYRQRGWLTFDQTYYSNDESGHIIILRDGDELPDYPVFDDQNEIASYLADILDEQGRIDVGTYDLVMLTELGSLNQQSADFQDAVILVQFSQPSC